MAVDRQAGQLAAKASGCTCQKAKSEDTGLAEKTDGGIEQERNDNATKTDETDDGMVGPSGKCDDGLGCASEMRDDGTCSVTVLMS